MKKGIGFAVCLLGFALSILFGVLAAVHVVGTDAELYYELQMKANVLKRAGISENDLIRLDGALAEYLKGNDQALHVDAEVFGVVQPAFNEKELMHMEDCFNLFVLLRTGIWVSAIAGSLLLTLGCVMLRNDRKKIRSAAWLAPAAIVVPLGMLAVWGMIDFNAAFNFFHEILFTNDLWLLNAATDLLIRICPASMFMTMGVRIGSIGLLWALIVFVLATAFTAKKERT